MKNPMGKKKWAIAEGYIPGWSNGPEYEFTSHEAICILNAGDEDAHIELRIFFKDKNPIGPYRIEVGAERTLHFRMNDLDPVNLPKATDYSLILESSVPVIVQHTRLDSRQAENALMTTIAYSEKE
jgi:hypothetical protein